MSAYTMLLKRRDQVNYNRKAIIVILQLSQISIILNHHLLFIVLVTKLKLGTSLHEGELKGLLGSIINHLKSCYSKCGWPFPTLPYQWHWHHLKLLRNVDPQAPHQTYLIRICILTRSPGEL